MIGARGWAVLLLVAAATFCLGSAHERARWVKWNYAHVAWDTKGDRK